MSEYKSFQGKNVDDAIAEACRHFKCSREELEVEILSGGSSGIFGLVGVKKAKIKARVRQIAEPKSAAASDHTESRMESAPRTKEPATRKPAKSSKPRSPRPNTNGKAAKPVEVQDASPSRGKGPGKQPRGNGQAGQGKPVQRRATRPVETSETPAVPRESMPAPEKQAAESRPVPADIDVEAARTCILESTRILLTNISDQGEIRIDMDKTPIEVVIEDDVNSGLIIGRDGQTLSSMQYLLNRIVSRKFPGVARIQLDAGDYREKQDEQLRKTAQLLAQKAKTSHRTQSTRPLSSYHRRVVHMALQDDRDILTRSKGDGPMKRVLIMARRKKNPAPGNGNVPVEPVEQSEPLVDHQES
ncbi:RNA-binding cell elongation regulator Jag/EloR [Desulfoplanes formicivorans]|uniref:RNA-binding protein KhpB n=1 Tax=Desulfoplanes formicivorans TaxID=1592317 RepID=A0A194AH51_9BACT|nr:RNA-binding cell elongation regulator Jag/EloR [Desulfoplanes formicivorans]GAU08653.1 single-stranded DNA-binding protein [Desulfoplanes formicivorans]